MAKKHPKINKRVIVTTIGVVVLLLAALGAGMVTQQLLKPAANNPKTSNDALTGGLPDIQAGTELSKELSDIQNLQISGNNAEANKKINEALDRPSTNDALKYDLYVQQGAGLKREGKLEEAYASYMKAEGLSKTQDIYDALARTAAQLGKKTEAIEAYKNAIKYASPDDPLYESDKKRYQQAIRNLGGQA